MKPRLISGIQPTGKLHIGNYLGALKNFVELQNSDKYDCFFFIADLHSLTGKVDPNRKSLEIMDVIESFLSAGIDPKRSTIFLQSAIPAHSELAVILNNFTSFGELLRMTQFKDKLRLSDIKKELDPSMSDATAIKIREEIEELREDITNVGLFDYPVLMAADIMLYDAAFVPVGDDQLQHLEFTRTLARKFNDKFGKTFIEPKPLLTESSRVMSLDEPTKKMSKSRPAGCLFLDDSPETIRKKIMSAVTDSGKEVKAEIEGKEGIGNLIILYSALSGLAIRDIEKRYVGKGYGDFKRNLAELAVKYLTPFQKKRREFGKKTAAVKKVLEAGNKKTNNIAMKKIGEIKEKIGLIL
jgi:tryptophanyl-tRNA synthetase